MAATNRRGVIRIGAINGCREATTLLLERRHCHAWIAALVLGLCAAGASATSNKVYRCTGANGKVTLSDRRCPDDDAAKPDAAARPAAGPSAAASADGKACLDAKDRIASERRKLKTMTDAERKALKALEDEHRRSCGA